jgi:hypothetical protein
MHSWDGEKNVPESKTFLISFSLPTKPGTRKIPSSLRSASENGTRN